MMIMMMIMMMIKMRMMLMMMIMMMMMMRMMMIIVCQPAREPKLWFSIEAIARFLKSCVININMVMTMNILRIKNILKKT